MPRHLCSNPAHRTGSDRSSPHDIKTHSKGIKHLSDTSATGLKFFTLELPSTRLLLFTDSSLINARGLKSQVGFVIVMADGNGKCNIVHYGLSRFRRNTTSVKAREVHALILGFDNPFDIREMTTHTLGVTLPIEAFVDSKAVVHKIAKNRKSTECQLPIDM